ncbi:MAG: hypothetical protein C0473_00215 [Cyanobacteria bacterium DS3.002]|nr:hypothetical protein [Cyanobacteria bacterium DS3.002]MBA4049408.1 hypothetical protein [Cyanobacteria bacterium DS2.008]
MLFPSSPMKVAQAFEAMGGGWSSRIVKAHDITGKHLLFILTHESLATLDDGGAYEDDGL